VPTPTPGTGAAGGQQQVQGHHVGARVPERIGRGVFATGMIVMTGQAEFVLDFLLRMNRPHYLVARLVVAPVVLPGFITAIRDNLAKYTARFGPPPHVPRPDPSTPRPNIQDIYDDLKVPDEVLAGSYANAVLISHSATEFCFDFLTNFFPHSAVSCRVFVAAGNVPWMLDSLTNSYEQYRRRLESPGQGTGNS
jgi:hypothetical protein